VSLLRWLKSRGYSITYVLQPLDADRIHGIPLLAAEVDRLRIVPSPFEGKIFKRLIKRIGRRLGRALLPPTIWSKVSEMWKNRPAPGAMRSCGTADVGWDQHIDRWCWPETCTVVRRTVRELVPVAVIAEYALLSKSFAGLPTSTLKVIDTVEVFFRNLERFKVDGLTAPFVCSPESEKEALGRADLLIGIQQNETRALMELFPDKQVITVGHSYTQVGERVRNPSRGVVLYVGSSNPFNTHGLRQFLTHAWPVVVSQFPLAQLRVVGSCPRIEGVDSPRVVYTGRVSDEGLRNEYRTAHVAINPQMAGTGLKIKCVEALTAGCAIVMNRAGADGIEEGAGRAFLLAHGWEEFAQHVLQILTDDVVRERFEGEAVRFADRLFSPEATFAELGRALADVRRRRQSEHS